jgi:hypothetical protein
LNHLFVTDEEEARFTGPSAPQILKYCGNKPSEKTGESLGSAVKDFLFDLLNALIVKTNDKAEEGGT